MLGRAIRAAGAAARPIPILSPLSACAPSRSVSVRRHDNETAVKNFSLVRPPLSSPPTFKK